MNDGYNYRSTGITRKVLIALERMPFGGCMMMAGVVGTVVGIALAHLLITWLDIQPLVGR